jgi:hypothetical protein
LATPPVYWTRLAISCSLPAGFFSSPSALWLL